MSARLFTLALSAAVIATTGIASAQSTKTPQTPPNAGSAEVKPLTVTGPGGSTTEPGPAPQPAAPAKYPDPANNDTASPPLGPQQNIGKTINRTVHYVVGDYIAPPVVRNPYSPGNKGVNYRSYEGRAVFELPVGQYDAYIGAEARKYTYPAGNTVVSGLPGQGRGFVPAYTGIDYDADVRAGLKVAGPRLYGAVSYLTRGGTTEPKERGLGVGIEKLDDVDQPFSIHGSLFYYPNVGGRYSVAGVGNNGVSYRMIRYLVGLSFNPPKSPLFLDAGFLGDHSHVRTDAPGGFDHQGPYVGVGIHF